MWNGSFKKMISVCSHGFLYRIESQSILERDFCSEKTIMLKQRPSLLAYFFLMVENEGSNSGFSLFRDWKILLFHVFSFGIQQFFNCNFSVDLSANLNCFTKNSVEKRCPVQSAFSPLTPPHLPSLVTWINTTFSRPRYLGIGTHADWCR